MFARIFGRVLLAVAFTAGAATTASAQVNSEPGGVAPSPPSSVYRGGTVDRNPPPNGPGVPRADVVEVMVRSALATFNDANLTGNYAVMNARLHPTFRQQAPAERLATIFAAFRSNKIDIGPALVHQVNFTKPAATDANGLLTTEGYFETRPWRTYFNLAWRLEGDQWWLWRINVNVKPPSP
ncbi:MAG: hypothetical protein KIT16_23255 [Rhodospirillaceae bacterium]|nr:hypothetical protein [Rhodospirillaceae bacterium]